MDMMDRCPLKMYGYICLWLSCYTDRAFIIDNKTTKNIKHGTCRLSTHNLLSRPSVSCTAHWPVQLYCQEIIKPFLLQPLLHSYLTVQGTIYIKRLYSPPAETIITVINNQLRRSSLCRMLGGWMLSPPLLLFYWLALKYICLVYSSFLL